MGILERQPRDLHGWLRIATNGLAPRAKERIRLEIEAHHAEAVSDHLRKGLSESEARSAALAELGDAGKAAKCFRKCHLTTREAEGVERTLSRLGSRWWLLFNYIYCACLFFAAKTHYRSFLVPLAVVFITTVIIPTFNSVMDRRKTKKVCSSILMEIVAWYAYGLSFIYFATYFAYGLHARLSAASGGHAVTGHGTPSQSHLLAGFPSFLVISVPLVVSFIPALRGWLRLRHVANVWDEIPLRNE
jgi:hypothetical protein